MARKPKKDSTSVRLAFTGPSIEADQLIDQAVERNEEDRLRASSAGLSRSKIKEFLEATGMNGKALSWLRMILKTASKDDGTAKAMDVIMSLEKALPMVKSHVAGQGTTPMDFEPAAASYATDFDPANDEMAPVLTEDAAFDDWDALDEPGEPADDETAE